MNHFNTGDLDDEAIEEINTALATLQRYTEFSIGINPIESRRLSRIDRKRYSFVKRALELAEANSYLQSVFLNFEKAKRDFTLYNQLGLFESSLMELSTKIKDTKGVAGHEAYSYSRTVYEQAQIATKKGMPGAKAIYEELKPFFEKLGSPKKDKI